MKAESQSPNSARHVQQRSMSKHFCYIYVKYAAINVWISRLKKSGTCYNKYSKHECLLEEYLTSENTQLPNVFSKIEDSGDRQKSTNRSLNKWKT